MVLAVLALCHEVRRRHGPAQDPPSPTELIPPHGSYPLALLLFSLLFPSFQGVRSSPSRSSPRRPHSFPLRDARSSLPRSGLGGIGGTLAHVRRHEFGSGYSSSPVTPWTSGCCSLLLKYKALNRVLSKVF